jgi:hypothetical protein
MLENQLSPLLDAGYLEEAVRRHFAPLFDAAFDEILRRAYPNGIVFDIGGRVLDRLTEAPAQRAALAIRLGRRRIPSAVGFAERHTIPQPEDQQGIAISTFGKVIRRGWDWLGLTPANASRISGLIEVPDLAACLTLNKGDFIRAGSRGATYLAYRKAIQEVASRQLAAWGDAPEHDFSPRTERLERDLERVIDDLADDFPLLRSLVDRRAGGQKRLPMPGRGPEQVPGSLFGDTRAWHGDVDAAVRERANDWTRNPSRLRRRRTSEGVSPSGEQAQSPTPESELPARYHRHRQAATEARPRAARSERSRQFRAVVDPRATASSCSSSHGPASQSWGASSTVLSGSMTRILHMYAPRRHDRPAIIWRSPSPSRSCSLASRPRWSTLS